MEFLKMLEEIRFPAADVFFQFCTFSGQDIPVLIIICILYWCLNKRIACQIGLTFFVSGLFLQNLKITFRIERPWILDKTFHPVASAIPAATGYSFPSGHTQTAASLFSTLSFFTKKWTLRLLCILLFLLVGFSRMYLGVHTPADVCTAIVIACASSLLIHFVMEQMYSKTPSVQNRFCLIISILLAAAGLGTLFYAWFLVNKGILPAVLSEDCFKSGAAGLGFAAGWYIEHTWIRFSEARSLRERILRFVPGILSTLLLKIVLKMLLGSSIPSEIIQYFFLVLWMTGIYPCFFRKIQSL